MTDREPQGTEHDFDAEVAALLREGAPEDEAALSAAVLTRIAQGSGASRRWVWIAPGALVTGFGGLMAASAAIGYIGLPILTLPADEMMFLAAFGGLLPGGF